MTEDIIQNVREVIAKLTGLEQGITVMGKEPPHVICEALCELFAYIELLQKSLPPAEVSND